MGRHAGLPLRQANVFLRSGQTRRSAPTSGECVSQIKADTQVCPYNRRMCSSDQGRHTGLFLRQANVFLIQFPIAWIGFYIINNGFMILLITDDMFVIIALP